MVINDSKTEVQLNYI